MASRVLVSGTGYDIKKGRVRVAGTGYDIKKGRVLMAGTGYDIKVGIDPHKMLYTESEFIDLCNAGLQNQMLIGAEIQLYNMYYPATFKVIGTDHDNTSGTVDVMSTTQITGPQVFGSSVNYQLSTLRNFLNNSYLPYFNSTIQSLAKTMSVISSQGYASPLILSDKVKAPSVRELGATGVGIPSEGERYPAFSEKYYTHDIMPSFDDAYVPALNGDGLNKFYWTRSMVTDISPWTDIWAIIKGNPSAFIDGRVVDSDYMLGGYVAIMRF